MIHQNNLMITALTVCIICDVLTVRCLWVSRSLKTYVDVSNYAAKDLESLPPYCLRESDDEDDDDNFKRKKRDIAQSFSTNISQQINEFLQPVHNKTSIIIDEVEELLNRLSDEFKNCSHFEIPAGCYFILKNDSVVIPVYHKTLNNTDYYIGDRGELFVCSRVLDGDVPKFDSTFYLLSLIGLGISSFCILLHMLMFLFVKALRNLPGYCLFSLCISLLMAYSGYFTATRIDKEKDCSNIGMLMYYSFLASFFWMNSLSFDIWRSLRKATKKLRLETTMWVRFAGYSAYSWGAPILILIITIVIDKTGDVPPAYAPSFETSSCWFKNKEALLVYFAVPFFILLGFNILFFVLSFFMITGASMRNAENNSVQRTKFCVFLRLALIMGLTWIFGVIGNLAQHMVVWYLYLIFNTSQGILIFFSFSFNEKTKKAFRRTVRKVKAAPMYSTRSNYSQQVTTI